MKLRTQLLLGYSVLFILMIVISSISYRGLVSLTDTANWVSHTHKAIGKAHLIEKSLIDMETGVRGFLITGNNSFLEPYDQGKEVYQETITSLKEQVADNPSQQTKLDRINNLVLKWHKLAATPAINLRHQVVKGAVDADFLQETLAQGTGKSILEEMRVIMDGMVEDFKVDGNIKGQALTEAIAKSMVDQETGQRGFLITGKEEFLEPYNNGQKKLLTDLTTLRKLIANAHDRIGTVNGLNELQRLAVKWEKEAGGFEINLRRQKDKGLKTQKELEEILAVGHGKSILDKMRGIMDGMNLMFTKAENDKAKGLIVQIAKSMVDRETGQRGFLITGKEEFLEPYISGQQGFKKSIVALQKLNANAYDIPRMKSNIAKLEDLAESWLKKAARPEIAARLQMNQTSTSMKDVLAFIEKGIGKGLMDTLRLELIDFINIEDGLLTQREDKANLTTDRNLLSIIMGTTIAIIIGIFTMLYITKKLITQVGGEPGEILKITNNLASGDLEAALNVADSGTGTGTGIYASVKNIIQVFKEKNDQANEMDWLKSGQNALNEAISGEKALLEITEKAIHFLAEYLNIQIGAIYIDDSKEESLQLMGSYAFNRRKGLNDRINYGQGLVGEAARTQKQICVTDLPDDYTSISSAIGKSLPTSVLVTPLIFEEKSKGVIELATFRKFTDIELEFIETVSTIIASAINSAEMRQQAESGLKKSQSLAEELQSQQDELKAANEELTEQTDALRESEVRLKTQSEELQASNEELEEKTEALNFQKEAIEAKNKAIESASKELKEKAEDLEIASKYKSEFLANMSHELRTPLNSLLILSEALADNDEGNLTQDQLESVNVIHAGGNDLLELINDILDLSKVEAGKLDIHIKNTPIKKVTETMKRQFQHVADKKNVDFNIAIDEQLASVAADKKRLEQILKNLLSNAFKFTEEGSVTLKICPPDSDVHFSNGQLTHENCIAFKVIDTGIGIDEEKQKSIFEAFQQADGSTCRKFGGTGLGLTISRELSRLMHGEIQVQSEPDEGSEFTLYLPGQCQASIENDVDEPKKTTKSPKKQSELASDLTPLPISGKSVLIIEDDEHFCQILKKIAEKKGYEVPSTDSGTEGISMATNYEPTAILLDLGLPDMDGTKVLEQLKFNLKTRHIPVHVLSGRDDIDILLTQGAKDCLTKPIDKREIESLFSQIDEFSNSETKSILLVDDDEKTLFAVKSLIGRDDLSIVTAKTASQAEKQILGNQFDCVILDLSLPDMSGFELLQKIKKEQIELPPVIIYTGRELSREEFNTLNEMAKSIVIKGAESSARLLDDVSLFLHSIEKRLPEEQQRIIGMLHDPNEILKEKRILLVDDDSRNIFAVAKLLQKHGMIVETADNGQMALDIAKKEDFDGVLMDIMMPVMDGYQATRELRKLKGDSLPIIAFTAKAMSEDRDKCLEVGANDYITKPLDSQKLISLLTVWLYK